MSSTGILLVVFSSGECWRNIWQQRRCFERLKWICGRENPPMTKTTSLNFIPSNSLYCWVDKSQCPCIASSGVVAAATGSFVKWERILKRILKLLISNCNFHHDGIGDGTNLSQIAIPHTNYHTTESSMNRLISLPIVIWTLLVKKHLSIDLSYISNWKLTKRIFNIPFEFHFKEFVSW